MARYFCDDLKASNGLNSWNTFVILDVKKTYETNSGMLCNDAYRVCRRRKLSDNGSRNEGNPYVG